MRNSPEGEMKFNAFLEKVKERTLEAFENMDFQFEDIVEKLALKREVGRFPLVHVGFTLQNWDIPELEIPGLRLKPYTQANRTSKVDITFIGREVGNELVFTVEYCKNLFKKETVKKFVTYFREIITTVIDNRDIRLKDIRITHKLLTAKADIPEVDFGI